jgi:hypothetical protein
VSVRDMLRRLVALVPALLVSAGLVGIGYALLDDAVRWLGGPADWWRIGDATLPPPSYLLALSLLMLGALLTVLLAAADLRRLRRMQQEEQRGGND